jgi:hypothetical protein
VAANPGEKNQQRRLFAGMLSALDVGVKLAMGRRVV